MSKDRDTVIADARAWMEDRNFAMLTANAEEMADFALDYHKRVAAGEVRAAFDKVKEKYKYSVSPIGSMEAAMNAVLAEMDGKE